MKLQAFLAGMLLALAGSACNKKDGSPNNNGGANNTAGFYWKEDGGSEHKADSAFWTTYTGGAGVRAYKGGMSNFFEINFSGSNVGTLQLGTGFTYLKGNTVITSGAGTVTIVSNAADKLSGNGSATVSGGGLGSVSFTFADLPKR